LPGDRYISPSAVVSTRAITIHAPVPVVWRWLVQIGQGRGGFYSYTWLQNLFAAGMSNTDSILPQFQNLKVGDRIMLQQNGAYAEVSLIIPERYIVLDDWSFALRPVNHATTRLVVRHAYDYSESVADMLYYYAVVEEARFVMESGMMLGIKSRAEQSEEWAGPGHTTLTEGHRGNP
jgi:hypothetical protein